MLFFRIAVRQYSPCEYVRGIDDDDDDDDVYLEEGNVFNHQSFY